MVCLGKQRRPILKGWVKRRAVSRQHGAGQGGDGEALSSQDGGDGLPGDPAEEMSVHNGHHHAGRRTHDRSWSLRPHWYIMFLFVLPPSLLQPR